MHYLIGFLAMTGCYVIVWLLSRLGRDEGIHFLQFAVSSSDNRLSLSRFQMYIWTFVTIGAYVTVVVGRREFVDIPSSVLVLMGISQATFLGAKFIAGEQHARRETTGQGAPAPATAPRKRVVSKLEPAWRPSLLDLVEGSEMISVGEEQVNGNTVALLEERTVPNLAKFQMFAWTLVLIVLYGYALFVHKGLTMPDIPPQLLGLMGISQSAYLGRKLTSPTT
ncbi:MAG: hypothetical protein L6435_16410 [Anaerolineae bacterium]|nr:hypothetical protein [Anaerolineae bacterium]